MIFKSIKDVISYLNGTYDSTKVQNELTNKDLRIEREKTLLRMLGNPQNDLKIIHVAGSKGKGTTSGHIAMLLKDNKRTTGVYLSPHVYDYRERWMYSHFNDYGLMMFNEYEYTDAAKIMEMYLHNHKEIILPGGIPPTTFELYTAYAMLLFRIQKAEYAVVETGIGGRLDATNALDPIVSVITHIEKEHTDILGKDLRSIAYEKAGIIKEGVPTFALHSGDEVDSVLREVAREKHSPLTFVDTNTDEEIYLKMRGKSARANFILAREVVKSLNLPKKHYPMSERKLENYYNGLLTLPARGEVIIERNSVILLDGAHTKDSVDELVSNIKDIILNVDLDDLRDKYAIHFDYGDIESFNRECVRILRSSLKTERSVIFALTGDKDAEGMLETLVMNFDTIVLTKVQSPYKKSDEVKLLLALEKILNRTPNRRVKNVFIAPSLDAALAKVESHNIENDGDDTTSHLTVITGSFYLCGEYAPEFND